MEWNTWRATKPEDKDEKESIFLLFIKETPSETNIKYWSGWRDERMIPWVGIKESLNWKRVW